MRAVLLAAGDDPRLRPHNARAPKALVPVDGVPILRRSLTTLAQAGVDHVTLVVGHLGDQIRTAVGRWFPGLAVEFVANPAFAATGTAASLALARPLVDGEAFVLCDGDVVFAPAAIDRLFAAGLDAVAVRSVGALDGEAVKVVVDAGDRVVAIGRDLPARGALGEAVGLASFTAATSRALFAALAPDDRDYEAAIQRVIDGGVSLAAVDLGSAYAIEIDTAADLRAAETAVRAGPAFAPRGLPLAV